MTTEARVTRDRLTSIVKDVEFADFKFSVQGDNRVAVLMNVDQLRGFPRRDPDATHTVMQEVMFSGLMSDEQILETIIHGTLSCVMHEVQERFEYRGEVVADPHKVGDFYPRDYAVTGLIRSLDRNATAS